MHLVEELIDGPPSWTRRLRLWQAFWLVYAGGYFIFSSIMALVGTHAANLAYAYKLSSTELVLFGLQVVLPTLYLLWASVLVLRSRYKTDIRALGALAQVVTISLTVVGIMVMIRDFLELSRIGLI